MKKLLLAPFFFVSMIQATNNLSAGMCFAGIVCIATSSGICSKEVINEFRSTKGPLTLKRHLYLCAKAASFPGVALVFYGLCSHKKSPSTR